MSISLPKEARRTSRREIPLGLAAPDHTIISSYSRMDCRSALGVRFRLPKNLPGHGGDVPLTAKNIVDKVKKRVSFGPIKVGMRDFRLVVPQIEEKSSNGVCHCSALAAKNTVPAYLEAVDV